MAHVPERYEDMSSPLSINQMNQLANKLTKMGWDESRVMKLGQANTKKFRAIEAILDAASLDVALQMVGSVVNDTTHLRFLQSATLVPTKGSVTLAQASDVFSCIDPNFKKWGTDVPGADTKETLVNVYEMKKDGTFATHFGSLGDPRSLCLTQGQIKEFPRTHPHLLRQDGRATLFLFEVNGELFVALVGVSGGPFEVYVYRFGDDDVWNADFRPRLVVPQQTV
ncbi:MAG: hypothetical protein AAB388_00115 [Patescibacteria group bacterium]